MQLRGAESGRSRWRRYWDRHASSYDRQMGFWDRRLFGDSRAWVCGQATGETLEVGIGTGLNLPFYPAGIRLTGVDFSSSMLARTRRRAADLQSVYLIEADAQHLPVRGTMFDTVVCTFSLCAVPDMQRAVAQMHRELRPGGLLLLADHIVAKGRPLRTMQRLVEIVSVPTGGEHLLRRPMDVVMASGLRVER